MESFGRAEKVAVLRPIGKVNLTIRDLSKGTETEKVISNNVLNIGRMALLQALSHRSNTNDVYFNRCVVSDKGADLVGSSYVERNVPRERDGLFGSELDSIAVVCSINQEQSGNPYLLASSVLGSESPANGHHVSEIGIKLADEKMYAMITWPGVDKTSSIEIVLDWLVYFL